MQGIQEISVHGAYMDARWGRLSRKPEIRKAESRKPESPKPESRKAESRKVESRKAGKLERFSCFSWFSRFLLVRSGLCACVFLLFIVFLVFVFTERPGRLGLLSRGQRFPVFPASRLLFPAICLCFHAFHPFHCFCFCGAAWAP